MIVLSGVWDRTNIYVYHTMLSLAGNLQLRKLLATASIIMNTFVFHYRINQCNLFCSAINKPFDGQALPLRCKRLFNMEQFSTAISNLEHRAMKRVKKAVTIETPDRMNRNETFYVVGSILFLREIRG